MDIGQLLASATAPYDHALKLRPEVLQLRLLLGLIPFDGFGWCLIQHCIRTFVLEVLSCYKFCIGSTLTSSLSGLSRREEYACDRQSKLNPNPIMGFLFSKASRWDHSTGMPDLSGKVIIVTGAKFVTTTQYS